MRIKQLIQKARNHPDVEEVRPVYLIAGLEPPIGALVVHHNGNDRTVFSEQDLATFLAENAPEERCPDCGEAGERKGHQTCQYPQD